MSTGDAEGPAWNKFWLSLDHETESMISDGGSHHRVNTPGHRSLISPDQSSRPLMDRVDSVLPNESASHNGGDDSHSELLDPPSASPEDAPFPFKFKAPSGRVHRLQVIASEGMTELIASVTAKLGGEIDAVGGPASFQDSKMGLEGYALSYLDNEGDTVSITNDTDLLDAITLARRSHRDKVDLFVHDPQKAPLTATLEPRPGLAKPLTPPASLVRERRRQVTVDADADADAEEEEGEETTTPVKRERKGAGTGTGRKEKEKEKMKVKGEGKALEKESLVKGVPNEILLPGIAVAVAVVVVGVFAMGRATKK